MSLTPWNRQEEWYQAFINRSIPDWLVPLTRQEEWYVEIIEAFMPHGYDTDVSGNPPLYLTDAVSCQFIKLLQYGKCEQADTPTPSNPVNIKCNNGTLTFVDAELPNAYKRVIGFQCNNNAMWEIEGFYLRGSDTVRVSFSVTAACNVWGCYHSTSATNNYDLYAATSSGAKYLRYGNKTYPSAFVGEDLDKRFDCVYTPTGTQGMPVDSTWDEAEFEATNDLMLGSTSPQSSSAKLRGKLYGDFIVESGSSERLHLVPCERVSDNVLGYYDLVGKTFYEPREGYEGAVSMGYDYSHHVVRVIGTPEVLTVSASGEADQTASVSDLLSVGNFEDTHELIQGTVTRNCGVVVLTGEESWSKSSSGNAYFTKVKGSKRSSTNLVGLSTHFVGSTASTANMPDNSVKFTYATSIANDGIVLIKKNDCQNATDFKTFITEQYNAGTPVIVVFPLATPTTETVTAQHLTTAAGTNTVSVTAEVSDITIDVTYKSSVE